jgi:pSer/pThr/pTyr-binding forkhead associated (FHA) protein
MRPLATIEQFIERLFEQPTARLFGARPQPIQILRRIERAMESNRHTADERTTVPNRFRVRLNPDDLEPLRSLGAALAVDLAEGALTFARAHHYAVLDRPLVDLMADPGVAPGRIVVDAGMGRVHDPGARPNASSPGNAERPGSGGQAEWDDARQDRADPGAMSRTRLFTVPVVEAPIATLREIRRDGTRREVTVDGRPLSIGRAGDNDLVVSDSRVSRHHARIQARRGALVLHDLGSTNGSRVNGTRVQEVVLGEGDRIEIGDTVLLVESIPGAQVAVAPPYDASTGADPR